VQALLPRALEVRIDADVLPELDTAGSAAPRAGRSPNELFGEYLTARGVADPAVGALFNRLHDDVASGVTAR
jgi:exonuclease SbcD